MTTQADLSALVALSAYRECRVHLFRSAGSLEWFVRQHRKQLVDEGALLMHTGQWHADPQRFDACVRQIGAQAAQRAVSAAR